MAMMVVAIAKPKAVAIAIAKRVKVVKVVSKAIVVIEVILVAALLLIILIRVVVALVYLRMLCIESFIALLRCKPEPEYRKGAFQKDYAFRFGSVPKKCFSKSYQGQKIIQMCS